MPVNAPGSRSRPMYEVLTTPTACAVLAAIDALSEHPYPNDAFPFGSTGLHRLRVVRYRGALRLEAPPAGLSWNQTWCELWLTPGGSSSCSSRERNHRRR
jgi:hypothetical protein